MSSSTVSKSHSPDSDCPWRDEETLRRLYEDDELSLREIGEKMGVATQTIHYWFKKHQIPRRKSSHDVHGCFFHSLGYPGFKTQHKGKREGVHIHRLVAVAEWGADALEGMEVHHKNGHKFDNRIENLALVTPEEHGRIHAAKYHRHRL